ncbi:hypothetical protein D5086_025602 [Populus alba]|uniref:Uncharacterized protein n=1 Tax=Populus alba TaxID=43335 RepID=A0ACC4B1F6_POPAL
MWDQKKMAFFVNASPAPRQFQKIQNHRVKYTDDESELALSKQTCRNRKQMIQFNKCNVISKRVSRHSVNSMRNAYITRYRIPEIS